MNLETKRLGLEAVQVKLDADDMRFAGYASVFGGLDEYGDTIDPKAYDRTLKRGKNDRPIRMRWNHWGPVIGKWVELKIDGKGLWVEGELTPGHSVAQDAYASLKHGAVDGLSIGYRPKKIEMLDDGKRRLLKEIELVEISVVEEPADLGARVGDVKSAIEAAQTLKEIEAILRDEGRFSRADACALVARIKALAHGERDAERKQTDELLAFARRHLFLPA
jgi:uncharacterized protein